MKQRDEKTLSVKMPKYGPDHSTNAHFLWRQQSFSMDFKHKSANQLQQQRIVIGNIWIWNVQPAQLRRNK